MRSREIANANCIVFGFIRSGTQYGYVSHYTTEVSILRFNFLCGVTEIQFDILLTFILRFQKRP
jgi:hypothetical protein